MEAEPGPSCDAEIEDAIDAFETACARDQGADFGAFLPPPHHPTYRRVLGELIRVDLELSWKRGQRKAMEDYETYFPRLVEDRTLLESIAFEEWRLRKQAGDKPSPADFERRVRRILEDQSERAADSARKAGN
jgi:hypothetical protein